MIQDSLVTSNRLRTSASESATQSSKASGDATGFADLLKSATEQSSTQVPQVTTLAAQINQYVSENRSPEEIAAFVLQKGGTLADIARATGQSEESLADYAIQHKSRGDNTMRDYLRTLGYEPAQSNFFGASNGIAPNALAIDLQDRPDLWGYLNEAAGLGLSTEQLNQGWASGTGEITNWLASLSPTQYAKLNSALYSVDKFGNFSGTTYGSPLNTESDAPQSVSQVWHNAVSGYNPALSRDVSADEYYAGLNRFGDSLPVFDNHSEIGNPNGRHLTWKQQDDLLRKVYGA